MQIKWITLQTKLNEYWKHGFGLHTRGNFVCNFRCFRQYLYILLDAGNDLEENISRLFHEVSVSISRFEEKKTQPITTGKVQALPTSAPDEKIFNKRTVSVDFRAICLKICGNTRYQTLNLFKTFTVMRENFERFQVCFLV